MSFPRPQSHASPPSAHSPAPPPHPQTPAPPPQTSSLRRWSLPPLPRCNDSPPPHDFPMWGTVPRSSAVAPPPTTRQLPDPRRRPSGPTRPVPTRRSLRAAPSKSAARLHPPRPQSPVFPRDFSRLLVLPTCAEPPTSSRRSPLVHASLVSSCQHAPPKIFAEIQSEAGSAQRANQHGDVCRSRAGAALALPRSLPGCLGVGIGR